MAIVECRLIYSFTRLSYAVCVVEALLKNQDKVDMYNIMYDVACMLHRHLEVWYGQMHMIVAQG